MEKHFRQGQILRLVGERDFHSQRDLATELRKLGIRTTQVTLSRDLQELGLSRTRQGYKAESPPNIPRFATLAGAFVQDIRLAQNIVVLRTGAGQANSVAVAFDQQRWAEVAGSVAGDDTILIVAEDNTGAQAIYQRIRSYFSSQPRSPGFSP